MNGLSNRAAIAGIGSTEFSKRSGRTELTLACEAIQAALRDAGIDAAEVDGLLSLTMDNTAEAALFRSLGGRNLKIFSRANYGGGQAFGPFLPAAMAVATGTADVVVVYRTMNERSEYRYGNGALRLAELVPADAALSQLHTLQGLRTPAANMAIQMRRYMHEYGATPEDFGRVAIGMRDFAATNPNAWFYEKPLTMEEYLQARMIADPFRLFDCCQQSDGAVAAVVVSAERARDLPSQPAIIRSVAQGLCDNIQEMGTFYRDDIIAFSEARLVADQLYANAGMVPGDMDMAIIYDHFAPTILPQLEAYGMCGRGEAPGFVADGHIARGGRLPVNTHGGQIGEAYLHGMNGLAEAVRQLRGVSVNQVDKVENILLAAGAGVPTSGLILGVA